MATKMESLFSELAEYFIFDAQKYTLEEFMSDIKTFKNQFKVKFFFPSWLFKVKFAATKLTLY